MHSKLEHDQKKKNTIAFLEIRLPVHVFSNG